MTKDELNEILKENGMQLATFRDGTGFKAFNITDGENGLLAKYTGIGFVWSSDYTFNQRVVKALLDYANTPIEERKPKPQLYNIIIAHDTDDDDTITAWSKDGEKFSVFDSATDDGLMVDEHYHFTEDEIHKLKQQLSEKEAAIVDLGITRVKTKKEEGALPF